jgi:hypothetical protein
MFGFLGDVPNIITIFLNFVVYSYTLYPFLFSEVIPIDPFSLCIPTRVELGLDEGFEHLPLSY